MTLATADAAERVASPEVPAGPMADTYRAQAVMALMQAGQTAAAADGFRAEADRLLALGQ